MQNSKLYGFNAVDFTREPIIETIITPREGFKLLLRNSKGTHHEEHFVEVIEIVSFGQALFFRSIEKPKNFLVPANDYEVVEVRETRMTLKNVSTDRSIKIAGGREGLARNRKESEAEEAKGELVPAATMAGEEQATTTSETPPAAIEESKTDKKRDKRTRQRRRRDKEEQQTPQTQQTQQAQQAKEEPLFPLPALATSEVPSEEALKGSFTKTVTTSLTLASSAAPLTTTLLPPPPTLISESLARYRDNALFKGAFYSKEEAPQEAPSTPQETSQESNGKETRPSSSQTIETSYPSLDDIDAALEASLPPKQEQLNSSSE